MLSNGTDDLHDELDLKLFRLQNATKKLVALLIAANLSLPMEIEAAKKNVASIVEEIESSKYQTDSHAVEIVPDDGSPDIPF